jgi:hypothetical protein
MMLDEDQETLAVAVKRKGRGSRRSRRRAPAPKRTRAWWPRSGGGVAARQIETPEPSPGTSDAPGLTLAEWLNAM